MARPKAGELTERELEVMHVFWGRGEQKNYATFQITLYHHNNCGTLFCHEHGLHLIFNTRVFSLETIERLRCKV